MKNFLILIFVVVINSVNAQTIEETKTVESIVGTPNKQKFSFHNPSYFILGDEDLKLQFSFKYRVVQKFPLYFAYSQLMFWDIYKESKPFADINYKPEIFYRLFSSESHSLKTLDFGFFHNSNGEDAEKSRSLDRYFARANYLTKWKRHYLNFNLMVYNTMNTDEQNADIKNHYGYWELLFYFTNLVMVDDQSLNLEIKTYAGKDVFDFDQGAFQLGLVYDFHSENFNPSIYLQFFEGYGESLINYNQQNTEWRLGLLLTF
jgi:phospholipase A1